MPTYATYQLIFHSLPFSPAQVVVDGQPTELTEVAAETGAALPGVVVGVGFGEVVVG